MHFFGMVQSSDGVSFLGTVDDLFIQVIVVQPCGQVAEVGVLVPVFVENIVSFDLKPEMIDAVGNRVDEVVTTELYVAAVVLYEMESCFVAVVIVISVEFRPFLEMMFPDIRIDGSYIFHRYSSVTGNLGFPDCFIDDLVQSVCGICSGIDIIRIGVSRQARIAFYRIGEPVKTGAGV